MSEKSMEYKRVIEHASSMLTFSKNYADQIYWLDVIKKNSVDLRKTLNEELRKKK